MEVFWHPFHSSNVDDIGLASRAASLSSVFVMWNRMGDALALALALAGEREFGFEDGLS